MTEQATSPLGEATLSAVPPTPEAPPASAAAAPSGRRLSANVFALTASQALTWTMTLLWTLFVPRALGPDQMGLWVSVCSVASIFGVLLGLPTRDYLVREMVAAPEGAGGLAGTVLVMRVFLIPVFFGAAFLYATLVGFNHDRLYVLLLVTGATTLALLTEPAQAVFQAIERMEFLAYSEVLNKTVASLSGIALVLAGSGVVGLGSCALAIAVLVLALNVRWVRPRVRFEFRTSARQMYRTLRKSAPYWAFGVFFMIYLWIDAVMLSLMAPPQDVGWYGVATRLFTTLMFVPVILATAWLPRLVKAFGSGPDRLRVLARGPLEHVVLVSLPITAVTVATALPVVDLIFGSAYRGAAAALVVLGLCVPFMYANIMFNQVLIAAKRPMVWTGVMAGASLVNPALNLIFIPTARTQWNNGAVGAALSLLVTEALIVVVGVAVVGRHVFSRSSVLRLAKGAVAALIMAAGILATAQLGLFVSAAAGFCLFLGVATVLRVATQEECRMMRALGLRLLSRLLSIRRLLGAK